MGSKTTNLFWGGMPEDDDDNDPKVGRKKSEAHKHTHVHTNNKLKYGIRKEWFSKKDDDIVDVGI